MVGYGGTSWSTNEVMDASNGLCSWVFVGHGCFKVHARLVRYRRNHEE